VRDWFRIAAVAFGLTLATGAMAEPQDALHDRLLGPMPDMSAVVTEMPERPDLPWWPVPAMLLGLGLLWGVRRRLDQKAQEPGHVRVLGRAVVDRTNSLVLIEVQDAEGRTRRLMVGSGGGSPRLVADLGTVGTTFTEAVDEAERESSEADRLIDHMLAKAQTRRIA